MKQKIIIILITMSLLGCSAKNSASKNGAILGTTAGAMAGGVMGLAVTATKNNSQDFTKNAIIGAVVVGAIGYLTGSAMGYVVDETSNKETKEIEKMAKSQKIVNKSVKHVPMTTPEAINNAQISNDTVEQRRIEDVEAPPRETMKIIPLDSLPESPMPEVATEESSSGIVSPTQKIVNKSEKHKPMPPPDIINNAQISNDTVEQEVIEDVDIQQESPLGVVSPIEATNIQSDSTKTIDMQEGKTLW